MAELLLVNPRKRRKRAKASVKRKRRRRAKKSSTPLVLARPARARRRRKRNPSLRGRARSALRLPSMRGVQGMVMGTLKPALPAAVGAIALDAAWANLPIPATLKTGPVRHVAKGAGAIVLGMVASKVVPRATAQSMAVGAMSVVIYSALKEVIAKYAPSVKLGDYWYDDFPQMGYYGAGQVAGLGMYADPATGFPTVSPTERMVGDPGKSAACMTPSQVEGLGMYAGPSWNGEI